MQNFSNNLLSNSSSFRPIKKKVPEYINNNMIKNDILNIDVNTIKFENISVELALNTLRINHTEYYNMSIQDMIFFYNEKMKLILNINEILALKIILKYKLKGNEIKVNEHNSILIEPKETILKKNNINSKINSNINNEMNIEKNEKNNFFNQIDYNQNQQNKNQNIFNKIENQQNNIMNIINNENNNFQIIQNNDKINNNLKKINIPKIETETKMGKTILNLPEFDIDSIINNYVENKNKGFIR